MSQAQPNITRHPEVGLTDVAIPIASFSEEMTEARLSLDAVVPDGAQISVRNDPEKGLISVTSLGAVSDRFVEALAGVLDVDLGGSVQCRRHRDFLAHDLTSDEDVELLRNVYAVMVDEENHAFRLTLDLDMDLAEFTVAAEDADAVIQAFCEPPTRVTEPSRRRWPWRR